MPAALSVRTMRSALFMAGRKAGRFLAARFRPFVFQRASLAAGHHKTSRTHPALGEGWAGK
jgi:hypothetical protein